jgi:hypothetical protein
MLIAVKAHLGTCATKHRPAQQITNTKLLVVSDFMMVGYDYDAPIDIFAVGFEEIVDLNASNIMKAR